MHFLVLLCFENSYVVRVAFACFRVWRSPFCREVLHTILKEVGSFLTICVLFVKAREQGGLFARYAGVCAGAFLGFI